MGYLAIQGYFLLWVLLFHPKSTGSHDLDIPTRICNGDFETPGRCFKLVENPLDWHSANEYCHGIHDGGSLARIQNQQSQEVVEEAVRQEGWSEAWINGCLKGRFWFWSLDWRILAFQGCYIDDPSNRALPNVVDSSLATTPTECIEQCQDMGFEFASVQLVNGYLHCRCGGWDYGKFGRAYDAECDRTCSGGLTGTDRMNQKCGGTNRQLVYFVKGTKFHAFALTTARSYDDCVVFSAQHNHQWVENSCHGKLSYICQHYGDEQNCEDRVGYVWANGVCITVHEDQALSFYEAQSDCLKYNAQLLRVEDANVYEGVKNALNPSKSYHFSLTGEEWIYSSHEHLTFYNWGINQPAGGDGQDCVLMRASDSHKWYNVNCETRYPFVCMFDIEERQSTTTTVTPPTTKGRTSRTGDVNGDNESGTDDPGQNNTTTISTDLLIGIGAGVGGAVVLFILLGLCIFCILRCRRNERRRQQSRRNDRRTRQRPVPPTPKGPLSQANPSYEPDVFPRKPEPYNSLQRPAEDPHHYDKLGDDYNYMDPVAP